MNSPEGVELTTKHPAYRAARRKLDKIGSYLRADDVAILFGRSPSTGNKWGQQGKFGAVKDGGIYVFDVQLVRKELGLPPLRAVAPEPDRRPPHGSRR